MFITTVVNSNAALVGGVGLVFYGYMSEDPDLARANGLEFNIDSCTTIAGCLLGPSVEPFKLVYVQENGQRLHLSLFPLL